MFDLITEQDLRPLLAEESAHCVSFYMPTHSSGPGVEGDPIRLKNLIAAARDELDQLGMRSSEAADLLRPVESMVDDAPFWMYSGGGLAVFATSADC